MPVKIPTKVFTFNFKDPNPGQLWSLVQQIQSLYPPLVTAVTKSCLQQWNIKKKVSQYQFISLINED